MSEFAPRRAVPEWVGATPDAQVPPRVRLRVFERFGGRCYLTGRRITPADKWEVEHVLAISIGGQNREANLAPVLRDRHKEKTAEDVAAKAKVDRQRAKHLGVKKTSRGFRKPAGARFDWSRGRYVKEADQ